MRLSLVIPCYNERANLPLVLERCERLIELVPDAEVVLVDNGSDDGSADVIARLLPGCRGCRSVRVPLNRGYGFGILAGLKAAAGDILAWTHGDMQTDPLDAARGYELFTGIAVPETLFVKGCRHGRPLTESIFSAGMGMFESVLMGHRLVDITAQPTMFHRAFLEQWKRPPHDYSLDLYAYHCARQRRLKIARIPVTFSPRANGESHWNVGRGGKADFIRRTLSYSFRLRRAGAAL